MEKNKSQRPLILEIEETKAEIIDCVNNAMKSRNLPCYFVEPIIADIYAQVREGAKNELETAKQKMAEAETHGTE